MYFDFDDYRPDITPVGSAISIREGVLLSIIVHMAAVILILVAPQFLPDSVRRPLALPEEEPPPAERPRFVFVQPRVDTPAPKPPNRADLSDVDRLARAPERAPEPTNPLPFSRGNSRDMVERVVPDPGPPPAPDPAESQRAEQNGQDARLPDAATAPQVARNTPGSTAPRFSGSGLSESLRNLQRTIEREQWDNQRGGGTFGPAIQFDTMGVEFGPWVRRFIAQVRRNWEPLIPLAAMSMSGHVVITFNVHKSGALTDLAVVQPCPIDAFNTAAYGALVSSNPTAPLPPEYPSDKAFFTVTFFYNEEPR